MNLLKFEQSKALYTADFVFYGAAMVALSVSLWVGSPPGALWLHVALVLAGALGWTVAEYAVHRFVLHGVQPFQRWHVLHHQRPEALICAPTWMSATAIAVLVFLPAWALGTVWQACALTLGVVAGYMVYALTHHAIHHAAPAHAWLAQRRHWHALHHRTARPVCYGVTTSAWDFLLGSTHRQLASD